jgi:hypothetical protein
MKERLSDWWWSYGKYVNALLAWVLLIWLVHGIVNYNTWYDQRTRVIVQQELRKAGLTK